MWFNYVWALIDQSKNARGGESTHQAFEVPLYSSFHALNVILPHKQKAWREVSYEGRMVRATLALAEGYVMFH